MIHYRKDDHKGGFDSVSYQELVARTDQLEDYSAFLDRPLHIAAVVLLCLLSAMIGALVGAWWTQ